MHGGVGSRAEREAECKEVLLLVSPLSVSKLVTGICIRIRGFYLTGFCLPNFVCIYPVLFIPCSASVSSVSLSFP